MKNRTLLILIAVFGLNCFLYSTRFGGDNNGFLTNAAALLPPMFAALYASKLAYTYKLNTPHGKSFLLISTGLLLWFIGEGAFFAFQFLFNIDPFPSVADIAYILGYALLFMGFMHEIRINKASLKDFNQYIRFLITLITALLVLAVIYFGVVLGYNPNDSLLANIIAAGYGFADIALIVPILYVLKMAVDYRGGKLFTSWGLILIALLMNLYADVFFAVFRDQYGALEWPYNMIDLVWVTAYLLFAYSFFNASHAIRETRKKLG